MVLQFNVIITDRNGGQMDKTTKKIIIFTSHIDKTKIKYKQNNYNAIKNEHR